MGRPVVDIILPVGAVLSTRAVRETTVLALPAPSSVRAQTAVSFCSYRAAVAGYPLSAADAVLAHKTAVLIRTAADRKAAVAVSPRFVEAKLQRRRGDVVQLKGAGAAISCIAGIIHRPDMQVVIAGYLRRGLNGSPADKSRPAPPAGVAAESDHRYKLSATLERASLTTTPAE